MPTDSTDQRVVSLPKPTGPPAKRTAVLPPDTRVLTDVFADQPFDPAAWRACCLGFHRNQAVGAAVRTLWRACLAFAQRRHRGVIGGARTLAAGIAPVGCRGARWLRTRSGQMASDPFSGARTAARNMDGAV